MCRRYRGDTDATIKVASTIKSVSYIRDLLHSDCCIALTHDALQSQLLMTAGPLPTSNPDDSPTDTGVQSPAHADQFFCTKYIPTTVCTAGLYDQSRSD